MPDDLTKKRPLDATRINLSQSWEIDYWSKKLNTTEEKLRKAVSAVGTSISAVKIYLESH